MIKPVYISFVGYPNSGKSESMEKVIEHLKTENHPVITFKHYKKDKLPFRSDNKYFKNNKIEVDSMIYHTQKESAIIINQTFFQKDLLNLVDYIFEWKGFKNIATERIVLFEEFRDLDIPQILFIENMEDVKEQLTLNVLAIAGEITKNDKKVKELEEKYKIPVVNLVEKPEDIEKILINIGNRA